MKGTIDVQIKHKDGSVETRHEHNVVFDIPALILKEFTEQPLRFLGGGMPALRIPTMIYWFNMSTELADLTKPRWIPMVLKTTGSTSSVWHTSPISRIVEEKKITMSATWTIGVPSLTIKSISVPGSTYSDSGNTDLYVDKYGVLCNRAGNGYLYQRVLSPSDYSFMNTSFSGMYPGKKSDTYYYSSLTSATGKPMYYEHYPLANPAERFIYYKPSTGEASMSYSPNSSGEFGYANPSDVGVRIIDHATRATLREFPLSQFEKGTSGFYVFVVVHSETKNWLLRSYSYTDEATNTQKYKTRIWQIPDTATTETIPCFSEDFGAGIDQLTPRTDTVNGNYLCIAHSDFTYANETWYKITDAGELVALPGAVNDFKRSNEYMRRLYTLDTLKVGWYNSSTTSPSTQTGGFYGAVYYPCLTSANFSTPIVLAEGDVLTVSYKIEVA